ncbi:YdeI/OmpD-associated family protein [Candidatus Woesearchaeota archaeon]|nr:YdeI/OmpD-associated family protein [Candidatus Woesearchaeota archaeon]
METPEIYAGTSKEWREWLRKNHRKENKVYLIKYKKHTGKPSLNNNEAMDDAICFGWIDTTVKRLDDERYRQCFMRRTSKSRWSKNTIARAKRMIAAKKMSAFGLKMYKEGLTKPTIDHNLPRDPATPVELKKALGKDLKKFEALSPSAKRLHIYMVLKAVRPETKQKRIKEIVSVIRKNEE